MSIFSLLSKENHKHGETISHKSCKKIKGKTILDHISFEVGQGESFNWTNGAGKTTLMSCILGDKS